MSESIRVVDLVKSFDDGKIVALRGVNFAVERGEFIGIMGPSGSGKSTLLHMIGALDVPTHGEVWLDGVNTAAAPNLDEVRARKIGFVFQLHNLIPTLTAVENVEIPMMGTGVPGRARRERAAMLLDQVGLAPRALQRVTKLSGGERQRVAIARAMANEPPILLADEPTGDVDSKTGRVIVETLLRMREERGTTLVVVTHNASVCEGADRTFDMLDGSLSQLRSTEVRLRAATER